MLSLSFIKKYRLHFGIGWLALFAVWYYLRADGYASNVTAFKVTLVKVTDLALMVCTCNYLLIPRLLYRKKYVSFGVCFITMILLSSLLKMNILGHLMNNKFLLDWNSGWKVKIYDNIIPHFFLVIAGAAVKLIIDYTTMQTRMTLMAKEKAEAELEFLKQQINPHFLFNSLNTVYFQIDRSNTLARETLHQFSEMLRYQLYETKGAAIPLETEIKYLREYVQLQKLRKDDHYKVELDIEENLKGFLIEPFLLMPFVENCFKHVSHFNEGGNYILIKARLEHATLYFETRNSTDRQPAAKQPAGIGLVNVKRRLELLYPGRHILHTGENRQEYFLQLTLQLNGHGASTR